MPEAAGLINLHFLHSVSQPMTALPPISAGLPNKPSPPFPSPLPKMFNNFPHISWIPICILPPHVPRITPYCNATHSSFGPCSSVTPPTLSLFSLCIYLGFLLWQVQSAYICADWQAVLIRQSTHTCNYPASRCQLNEESLLSPCLFLGERINKDIFSPLPTPNFHWTARRGRFLRPLSWRHCQMWLKLDGSFKTIKVRSDRQASSMIALFFP